MPRYILPYEGGNPFLIQCDRIINDYVRSQGLRYTSVSTINYSIRNMRDFPLLNLDREVDIEAETNWLRENLPCLGEICQAVGINFNELVYVMIREGYNTLNPNDIDWWRDNENLT